MIHAFTPYLVQFWQDQKLVNSIEDLSIDAARHLARVHAAFGENVRVWADNGKTDHIEAYFADGSVLIGSFGETTKVRIPA